MHQLQLLLRPWSSSSNWWHSSENDTWSTHCALCAGLS